MDMTNTVTAAAALTCHLTAPLRLLTFATCHLSLVPFHNATKTKMQNVEKTETRLHKEFLF